MAFLRREHQVIAALLGSMNSDLLLDNACFFGGGTAIVLKHGEYRRSLDVDFLCAEQSGYRTIRNAVMERGIHALFGLDVMPLREIRADSYGVRTLLSFQEQQIKFEIIREGRIALHGHLDDDLNVPILSADDMIAEKLLANSDRCYDASVCYRDAIDLGKLVEAHGALLPAGVEKAELAYGADIARKVEGVLGTLCDPAKLRRAAETLDMQFDSAQSAILNLRAAAKAHWPTLSVDCET